MTPSERLKTANLIRDLRAERTPSLTRGEKHRCIKANARHYARGLIERRLELKELCDALPNARMWAWINDGWVKLTLRPDGEASSYRHSKHDEGWSSRYVTWYYCPYDENVTRTTQSDGRCSDGRFQEGYVDIAPVTKGEPGSLPSTFRLGEIDGQAYLLPATVWEDSESYQRDHSAEAMGY